MEHYHEIFDRKGNKWTGLWLCQRMLWIVTGFTELLQLKVKLLLSLFSVTTLLGYSQGKRLQHLAVVP